MDLEAVVFSVFLVFIARSHCWRLRRGGASNGGNIGQLLRSGKWKKGKKGMPCQVRVEEVLRHGLSYKIEFVHKVLLLACKETNLDLV